MGWPRLLVLVRHAESTGNTMTAEQRAGFSCATHEYPLTERGREQAAITGERVRAQYGAFDVRYTSYYARARETMEILAPKQKCYVDARLAEAQRGLFHIMTKEQMAERYPEVLQLKEREGYYHFRPPCGENWMDIEARIHSFLGTLARDCADARVLIVVHGHWLLLFQRLVHHFSIEEAVERYTKGVKGGGIYRNASVTTYKSEEAGERSRLVLVEENTVPWEGLVEENHEVT